MPKTQYVRWRRVGILGVKREESRIATKKPSGETSTDRFVVQVAQHVFCVVADLAELERIVRQVHLRIHGVRNFAICGSQIADEAVQY